MGLTIAPGGVDHYVKVKSADETVNNSATLQNDDHLFFTINPSEIWVATFHLFVSAASATPDLKFACSLPTSPTASAMGIIGAATTVATNEGDAHIQSFTDATVALTVGVQADSSSNSHVIYSVYVENGANAGTAQLQWAQSTANASDSKVRKGSYMVAHRVS